MTRPHLRPCLGCSRHVRVSEGACPFCGVSLEASFAAAPAPVPPSRRLSRAALFAFGTGVAVLTPVVAIDCSSDDSNCCPPYGAMPPDLDASAFEQDSALTAPDVHVGSADAGDSSVGDAGGDAGADGAAPDAVADTGETD